MIPRLVNSLFHPRRISIAEWLEGMRRLDAEFPLPAPRFAPGMGKPCKPKSEQTQPTGDGVWRRKV